MESPVVVDKPPEYHGNNDVSVSDKLYFKTIGAKTEMQIRKLTTHLIFRTEVTISLNSDINNTILLHTQ